MSRVVRLAAAAAFGGLLVAITAVSVTRWPAPHVAGVSFADEAPDSTADAPRLSRCRTITVPESRCEAVWDEKRRRFFRKQERRP
ncbi:MAG: putative entry exclusion protein TrbK-alt [Mesorhizobium sp.]|nr:putative entry exclusion protein TrbK-alt [Mesorhizobium sp.]